MKDFQGFINRDNALWDLGNENWDLEDALESHLLSRGINRGKKSGNQRNAMSTNMIGIQMFVTSDPDGYLAMFDSVFTIMIICQFQQFKYNIITLNV